MLIDNKFKINSQIQLLNELPSGQKVFYYPGLATNGGKDGIIIKFEPHNGDNWVGMFAFGEFAKNGFSGVFSMPDPNKLCVVSNGTGYIVDVKRPELWEEVKSIPIKNVISVSNQRIILFVDYTDIIAYGENGVKWHVRDISLDGIKIKTINKQFLIGEYYDLSSGSDKPFEIDLLTGEKKYL